MSDIIQIRRDTAANWTSADSTLAQGEFGYETDTGKLKIGDGSTEWTSLGYSFTTVGFATLTGAETLTNKRITERVVSTTSTATLTIDSDSYDIAKLTAQAAALTIAAPTGTPTDGQKLMIRIKDNGTTRALTWNAAFVVEGVTLPTTTTVSKWHRIGCMWCSTDSKWKVIAIGVAA